MKRRYTNVSLTRNLPKSMSSILLKKASMTVFELEDALDNAEWFPDSIAAAFNRISAWPATGVRESVGINEATMKIAYKDSFGNPHALYITQEGNPHLEVTKMLTISTAHLSEETCNWIAENIENETIYEKSEYGWFVYITDELKRNAPQDLRKCMSFAASNGCRIICFDRDGNIVPILKVYG